MISGKTKIFICIVFTLCAACTKGEYDIRNMSRQLDVLQNTRFKVDSTHSSILSDTLLCDALGLSAAQLAMLAETDESGVYYNLSGYTPLRFDDIQEFINLSKLRQMVKDKNFEIDSLTACGDAENHIPMDISVVFTESKDTVNLDYQKKTPVCIPLSNIRTVDSVRIALSGRYDGKRKIRPGQEISFLITSAIANTGITFNKEQ